MKVKLLSVLFLGFLSSIVSAGDAIWVDVRTAGEFQNGHLAAATNIPHGEISARLPELSSDKNAEVYLYCRSGNRAGKAKAELESMGYTNVTNVGSLAEAEALYGKMEVE